MSEELFSDEETKILANSITSSTHRYSALDSTEDISHKTERDARNVQEFQLGHGDDSNDRPEQESIHIPLFEKYCKTFALSCLMFGMGTMHAIIGPTLLDLAYGLSVTLSQVSLVFVGQATGFIIGVVIGGMTCDYMDHWLLMLVVLIGAASLTMAVPFWPTLATLVIASLFRGACMRALELVVNIALLDLWGKESSSPMQQLHFTVAVGCGVVPLLVKPFAGKEISVEENKRSTISSNIRQITATNTPLGSFSNLTTSMSQSTMSDSSQNKKLLRLSTLDDEASHIDLEHSSIEWVYIIVGIINLVIAIYLLFIYCCFPQRKSKSQNDSILSEELSHEEKIREYNFRIRFIPIGVILLALYFGVLLAYDGYLVTFAVISDLKMNVHEATTLSATFWLTFAFGRFLAIFYSMYLSDYVIMHIDVFFLVLSSIPLSTSIVSNVYAFYFCSMIFALSFASLGPAALSYTSRYLTINGKIGAIYMVGGSCGEIVLPFIIAYMMDNFDPMWLMYIVTFCTLCLYPLAAYKFYLAGKHGEKKD